MIKNKKSALSVVIISALNLAGCSQNIQTHTPSSKTNNNVVFSDVSEQAGLITQKNWKYGGPTIADINSDGHYDLLLTNHDTTPIRLFMANGDNTYTLQDNIFPRADLHGMSAGDYDNDGDLDVLIALGGGNGTKPKPQRLLKNNNGKFEDKTVEAGLSKMGARGRSVRWIDVDGDGDLDFIQINAEKLILENSPRNIIFENIGNGKFAHHPSPSFENIKAERVLLTDYNNDNILDIFGFDAYNNLSIYKGNNDFSFTDETNNVITNNKEYKNTLVIAQADIDNDGDMDYYLARGKPNYQIANNSISYNKENKRLDLRDEGNKSHDGITLITDNTNSGSLILSDFYHFPRAKLLSQMDVYIGEQKKLINTPNKNTTISQQKALGFPTKLDKTGWYIGYLGNNKWRVEWVLTDNLAWDIRASFKNVAEYQSDWQPQNQVLTDVLLRNDNGKLVDISSKLPALTNSNNWGVVPGDFNNDTKIDFMVYRFGKLKERISDVLLINQGDYKFEATTVHNANTEIGQDSHGDMGAAFDYDQDGKLDLLSGDTDNGQWHLYKNTTELSDAHYTLIRVGYSKSGIDPYGAKVQIKTPSAAQYQVIGSQSASHSQSLLNIVHFGLAQADTLSSVVITWRDGSQKTLTNVKVDSLIKVGEFK
ncbi:CRTAC1 family protein [Pseudoalteromonas sp. NZS127_1]|uniref:CRTAC1 family protein n=1 Tax=Pseudoalteromonas sp. NZS127_1 TaxID=2792074 RepID=UPI0018CF8174|nr:CRTAC1 family protein [Pseudoalteromonas sp. NZS127_1]MBG9993883.1 CRTAC1 family protein [Pseudoalteromonas sp. NZS127_1]